jgi:hypothetical protein
MYLPSEGRQKLEAFLIEAPRGSTFTLEELNAVAGEDIIKKRYFRRLYSPMLLKHKKALKTTNDGKGRITGFHICTPEEVAEMANKPRKHVRTRRPRPIGRPNFAAVLPREKSAEYVTIKVPKQLLMGVLATRDCRMKSTTSIIISLFKEIAENK